jgi:hypothetical protein
MRIKVSRVNTPMQVNSPFIVLASLSALVLGAIMLGGGIYETLLVDRAWPDNPAIIQPNRGGINRGLFWMPAHTLYELALFIALWLVWGVTDARWWTVAALAVHFAARTWSMAYFIPRALRFEKLGDLTEEQRHEARRWTRLSRCRPILEAVSIMALCVAILHIVLR